jgi:threonine/homoserine/homoserine lactone efflux protein
VFFKGFRFGLMLQLAIGPVCLFILSLAMGGGLGPALSGLLAVTLVDAAWVAAAGLGLGAALRRPTWRAVLRVAGPLAVAACGVAAMAGGIGQLAGGPAPAAAAPTAGAARDAGAGFAAAFLLTVANPLTILFWGGVFGTKAADEGFGPHQLASFGAGAVAATPLFLGAVALLGSALRFTLPPAAPAVLNCLVGLVLIAFAVRGFLFRGKEVQA